MYRLQQHYSAHRKSSFVVGILMCVLGQFGCAGSSDTPQNLSQVVDSPQVPSGVPQGDTVDPQASDPEAGILEFRPISAPVGAGQFFLDAIAQPGGLAWEMRCQMTGPLALKQAYEWRGYLSQGLDDLDDIAPFAFIWGLRGISPNDLIPLHRSAAGLTASQSGATYPGLVAKPSAPDTLSFTIAGRTSQAASWELVTTQEQVRLRVARRHQTPETRPLATTAQAQPNSLGKLDAPADPAEARLAAAFHQLRYLLTASGMHSGTVFTDWDQICQAAGLGVINGQPTTGETWNVRISSDGRQAYRLEIQSLAGAGHDMALVYTHLQPGRFEVSLTPPDRYLELVPEAQFQEVVRLDLVEPQSATLPWADPQG